MADLTSRLARQSSNPLELLRATLNEFGSYKAIAEHFGRDITTVYHWKDRLPGRDIRETMQNYLNGQERYVTIRGETTDGRKRDIDIVLNREDNIKYSALLAAGKPEAANVFLLAAEHGEWAGVPALAGADWYDEWEDLYDSPDFEYDTDYYLQ